MKLLFIWHKTWNHVNSLVIVPKRYNATRLHGVNPHKAVELQAWRYLSLYLFHSCCRNSGAPNATDSGVLGGWWFGASPSSPDSNFLRVHNAFPNRRLSDNALMMPPKIRIAPSCASSPGGTPGGGGLPIRRHSSIGPQERRGSTVNLSPPTVSTKLMYLSLPCAWHVYCV